MGKWDCHRLPYTTREYDVDGCGASFSRHRPRVANYRTASYTEGPLAPRRSTPLCLDSPGKTRCLLVSSGFLGGSHQKDTVIAVIFGCWTKIEQPYLKTGTRRRMRSPARNKIRRRRGTNGELECACTGWWGAVVQSRWAFERATN